MIKSGIEKKAFPASLPILFGYVPIGVAFGLVFNTLGYPWYYAALSALFVYAGAAQFLSIGLLSAGAGLTEVFLATLTLNLRHVFYGFSFLSRYAGRSWRRWYLIFGLTDETYSVLTTLRGDEAFCLRLTALNQLYWVAGCSVGALAGSRLKLDVKGLDFVLTALFVVLTIEQALTVRRVLPFALAAAAGALALLVFPSQMLLVSTSLVAFSLICLSTR